MHVKYHAGRVPVRFSYTRGIFWFSLGKEHGMLGAMNALKERIIEKLEGLPEPALKQVMDYLTFLRWQDVEEVSSLLSVAGGLSGPPISATEIEQELYGPLEAR
ncbi:MAG TPA: hypothetical protein VH595_22150 [Verrucomicrobiae bacterium]|jgi:hypothetical protein|nr:hypothetical protein [Verrucomicrobiae bacterium]